MKNLLKLENLGEFLLGIFVFSYLDFSWWYFPALLLLPDLSMIGYLIGPSFGAIVYNFFHHKALGILIGITGFYMADQTLMLAGVILFAHAAMDRIFGYGLKYPEDFKHTHLGKIGASQ